VPVPSCARTRAVRPCPLGADTTQPCYCWCSRHRKTGLPRQGPCAALGSLRAGRRPNGHLAPSERLLARPRALSGVAGRIGRERFRGRTHPAIRSARAGSKRTRPLPPAPYTGAVPMLPTAGTGLGGYRSCARAHTHTHTQAGAYAGMHAYAGAGGRGRTHTRTYAGAYMHAYAPMRIRAGAYAGAGRRARICTGGRVRAPSGRVLETAALHCRSAALHCRVERLPLCRSERYSESGRILCPRRTSKLVGPSNLAHGATAVQTVTFAIATAADYRTVFYHRSLRNRDGSAVRCRVTGRCKTWVRRPDDYRLPVKHGLRDSFYIEPSNAADWLTEEPGPLPGQK
jgi:hypothetical protein